MVNPMIKGLKRCPSCKSSCIYKRTRAISIEIENRKKNGNKIEKKMRMYRCHQCRYEFDKPIII